MLPYISEFPVHFPETACLHLFRLKVEDATENKNNTVADKFCIKLKAGGSTDKVKNHLPCCSHSPKKMRKITLKTR
jgi:hypothetical protein